MTSLKEKMEKISKYNKKTANKGISPVIASIILIAITIAIAVAIGGFVFGLFGSFTQSGGVQVINPSLTAAGVITGSVVNSKDTAITLTSISATGDGGALASVTTVSIVPSSFLGKTGPVDFTATFSPLTPFTAGTSYTARISFSDGTQVAVVVTAS